MATRTGELSGCALSTVWPADTLLPTSIPDHTILVGQFAGDCQGSIGVVGCLRPIVRVEVDMAMGWDQSPGFAAAVAKLDSKLAGPLKGLQRLCNGGSVVQPNHVVGTPEPQQRFHLLGRRALFCRLTHGELQVGRGLAAAE